MSNASTSFPIPPVKVYLKKKTPPFVDTLFNQ
jgi:hypothetical protein